MPFGAPGRRIAATARRFNCSLLLWHRVLWGPFPPTVLWLVLSAPPACGAFRLWCSATTPKWNVWICSNVYAHASQKSMLPNHARAPPKNQRCLSRISMRSSSLLAHTSPDDTGCLWQCDVRGMWHTTGEAMQKCRISGGGWSAPAPQRFHDRGEASRELAALLI